MKLFKPMSLPSLQQVGVCHHNLFNYLCFVQQVHLLYWDGGVLKAHYVKCSHMDRYSSDAGTASAPLSLWKQTANKGLTLQLVQLFSRIHPWGNCHSCYSYPNNSFHLQKGESFSLVCKDTIISGQLVFNTAVCPACPPATELTCRQQVSC